jgi:hypothetical protein
VWTTAARRRRLGCADGIADADAELVEGAKDVCVTA